MTGDDKRSGKIFSDLVGPRRVIVQTGTRGEMRQHNGFDFCLRGRGADVFQRHMALGRLLHDADLLRRSHCLPAAVGHHRLLAVFAGRRFGYENLGIFGQRGDSGAGAGVASENDDAIGGFETIGYDLCLPAASPL